MEGRVFVCSWKQVGGRYRVWVKKRPKLAAEGASFAEADERLWEVILAATGDGENQREYDPPVPTDPAQASFLSAGIVTMSSGTHVSFDPSDALFTGGVCRQCRGGRGDRTDVPFVVDESKNSLDEGATLSPQSHAASRGHRVFSEQFLALLSDEERSRFEWRPVVRGRRAKKAYYELVTSRVHASLVAVSGLPPQGGWRCDTCGFARLPWYRFGERQSFLFYVLCSADLPDPLPTCFTIGVPGEYYFCATQARWRKMIGRAGTRGLLTQDVGVVEPDRCERHPVVRAKSELDWER